jgi:hypothetical protein
MRVHDLTVGALVYGLVGREAVTVVHVRPVGTRNVEVSYRTSNGHFTDRELISEEQAERLILADASEAWAFAGDPDEFLLAAEARRIRYAHQFDPMLAVHLSRITPLPIRWKRSMAGCSLRLRSGSLCAMTLVPARRSWPGCTSGR